MQHQTISVASTTIIRFFLIVLAFWVAYVVRDVLLLVFIALILTAILHPLASWGESRHIPRGVTVFFVYLFAAALFVGVGLLLFPLLSQEISQIQDNFLNYWEQIIAWLPPGVGESVKNWTAHNVTEITSTVKSGIGTTIMGVLSTVEGVFGAIGSIGLVLVLAYFMVVEHGAMHRLISNFVPDHQHPLAERMIENIERRLGGWVRGQLLLALIIGTLVFISLALIGVPYAFALAVLAGLLEFIPYIGPMIAGVFGIFFALTLSPTLALFTALAYYIIQLLEGHYIVPKVMEHAAGISPIISLVSIFLCFELFGLVGVFLGVPIAALVIAVVESLDRPSQYY